MQRPPRDPTVRYCCQRRIVWAVIKAWFALAILAVIFDQRSRWACPSRIAGAGFHLPGPDNMGLILVNRSFKSSLVRCVSTAQRSSLIHGRRSAPSWHSGVWPPHKALFIFGDAGDDLAVSGVAGSSLLLLEGIKSLVWAEAGWQRQDCRSRLY